MSVIFSNNYLTDGEPIVHWRTAGSKNGIRLWQNKDGSYTEAGRNFKIGGRYNSRGGTGERLTRAERKEAKRQADIENTRVKNERANEEIARRIPYSRDDLSDYEKAQEISLMNNQLKYLESVKEYNNKQGTHFEKVGKSIQKELESAEVKLYISLGLGALGIAGAYALGKSGGIDAELVANAINAFGGKYGKIFNAATQVSTDGFGKVKEKVAAVVSPIIDKVKNGKTNVSVNSYDPTNTAWHKFGQYGPPANASSPVSSAALYTDTPWSQPYAKYAPKVERLNVEETLKRKADETAERIKNRTR